MPTKKPPTLKVVGDQKDSTPAAKSRPRSKYAAKNPSAKTPEGKAKRDEALARGRATRAANTARRRELRAAGVKSNIERWRDGEYPPSMWTDEEIKRGRPAHEDGTFQGPPPSMTGKQAAEIRDELLKRGQRKMDAMFDLALETLKSVAIAGEQDSARVKAALAIIERVAGKVPDKVEIKSSDPWQDILDEIIADEDIVVPVKEET